MKAYEAERAARKAAEIERDAARSDRQALLDAVFARSEQDPGHEVADAVARIKVLYALDVRKLAALDHAAQAETRARRSETRVRELERELEAERNSVLAVRDRLLMFEQDRAEAVRLGLVPDHQLIFGPNDPNKGRSCITCGLSIPAGSRVTHSSWCRTKNTTTKNAEAQLAKAEAEVDRLKRLVERSTPWCDEHEEPTEEQLRALRTRWATGPELYQADADILISGIVKARERAAAADATCSGLREELQRSQEIRSELQQAVQHANSERFALADRVKALQNDLARVAKTCDEIAERNAPSSHDDGLGTISHDLVDDLKEIARHVDYWGSSNLMEMARQRNEATEKLDRIAEALGRPLLVDNRHDGIVAAVRELRAQLARCATISEAASALCDHVLGSQPVPDGYKPLDVLGFKLATALRLAIASTPSIARIEAQAIRRVADRYAMTVNGSIRAEDVVRHLLRYAIELERTEAR